MNTKILLISLYGIENSGVRILSAILKQSNYNVSVIFFKNWKNNNIKEPTHKEINLLLQQINKIKPDIVGISFGSPYFNIVISLSKQIKENFRNIFLIFGGIHSTTVPECCIKYCDAICIGEGDQALLEFINRFEKHTDITTTPNFWFNINGQIIKNNLLPLIVDLNALPFKDLSNKQKYYIDYNKISECDPILNIKEFRISASRGCLFQCSYCYNSVLRQIYSKDSKYYRIRSVDNVIEEILYAKRCFKSIKRIKFDDDTFIADTKWIDEFCNKYKNLIQIPFDIMLTPQILNYENLDKLKKAGLIRIQMGIEGSSKKETENHYQRTFSNDKIYDFSFKNQKLKIDIAYDIIIDNPMTTEQEKEELFLFLLSLKSKFKLFIYSLVFFPKTLITTIFLQKGLITNNDVEGNNNKCFNQFRASFDYKRSQKDMFYFSMFVIVSKAFIPKFVKKYIFYCKYFRNNVQIVVLIAKICNICTMIYIFFQMLCRGEISIIKLREYGNLKKLITQ